MIAKTKLLVLLPLIFSPLQGCRTNAPTNTQIQTPAADPQGSKPQGCDALTDPAAAEDCRFRAEVLKKRQKSKATPVVTHAPGTIEQP